jgi:hypothetical protein
MKQLDILDKFELFNQLRYFAFTLLKDIIVWFLFLVNRLTFYLLFVHKLLQEAHFTRVTSR